MDKKKLEDVQGMIRVVGREDGRRVSVSGKKSSN